MASIDACKESAGIRPVHDRVRRPEIQPAIEVTATPSIVIPAHKLDVLLRHDLLRQPSGFEDVGSGVRFDLVHLDVLEHERVRSQRPKSPDYRFGGVLRLEDDHPHSRVVFSCPVSGYESWGLRHPRYDLLVQFFSSGLDVSELDPNDNCVHRSPPLSLVGRTLLRQPGGLLVKGVVTRQAPWESCAGGPI